MHIIADISKYFTGSWLLPAAILAGAIAAGYLLHLLVSFILNLNVVKKNVTIRGIELRFEHLRPPLRALFPAIGASIALPFAHISPDIKDIIDHILRLWVIASLTWLAVRIIYIIRDVILSRYRLDQRDNLRARRMYTQIRVIQRVVSVVILIIGVSIMLMTFEKVREIGVSLLASAGVIGIILGFAAQRTLGNLIAGIQIAIAQPIKLEDVVVVEGEWGWIEEITLTYVVVRIWDLRRLIVPISYFIQNPIQNWTRKSADLLGYVYIYTDYTVPVGKVREELTKILEASDYWDKKTNVLQVTNATERTVELRALMSASDSPTAWNLRCEVREKLLDFLQKNYPRCLPKVRLETEQKPDALPQEQKNDPASDD